MLDKAQAKILNAEFVQKESSGLTIAPASDRRQAVDAVREIPFSVVEEDG
jgi:hypothetical protein